MNLDGPAAMLPQHRCDPIGPARPRSAPLCSAASSMRSAIRSTGSARSARSERWPLAGKRGNPLDRARVTEPFDIGVRAVNALLTAGVGQRIAIVAGSGVGKSVLMGQMIAGAEADVIVVGLIGERSREVTDFLATKLAGRAPQERRRRGSRRSSAGAAPARRDARDRDRRIFPRRRARRCCC